MNKLIVKQLEMCRRMLNRWLKRRAGEYPFPEEVGCIADVCPEETAEDYQRMDIYYPKETSQEKRPVIVDFHGGGMVLCDRKTNGPFCAELAKRGFVVFCLDYPLVPQADIPRILREVAARMEEVGDWIDRLNGDRDRVFLVGDSAGAFISVYELAAQKNPEVARCLELTPTSLKVKAAAFISGMFYTTRTDVTCMFLRQDFYGRNWRKHPFRPYMDPAVPEVAGQVPPCWLLTSGADNLRKYTLDFAAGLKRAGIPYTLRDLPLHKDMGHDFVIIKPEQAQSQAMIDEICEFFLSQ